ncbi:alpha/beta-hydrolase [Lophiostoma macrostomum CBS 122681]|uniref:Putative phospholipase n=1 Tax=Lophiostoma macrostomum CBS 122681 TaxID=1314788 RepID=A0A6A6SJM9_9PLEO|nr:alpha/beta-hydrolase [Lophiostoma macrostomum CBS 122681]
MPFFRRLSPRRLMIFGSAFVLFGFFAFSLAPITSPLPRYTGPHEVGVLDVEVEVEPRLVNGNEAVLKETGERAFELSTLAVTLYYPSTIPPPAPGQPQPYARPWLPQPISLIGTGYARLARVYFPPLQALFTFTMWALGSSTVIPGIVDAPLLSQSQKTLLDESGGISGLGRVTEAEESDGRMELRGTKGDKTVDVNVQGIDNLLKEKFPCVVFTHGMAGMSQSYSHYLGSIASHGYVVAAIEHRDGSGPGTIVHHPNGTERRVWHLQLADLSASPAMTAADLKVAQLAFREAEIHETVQLFQNLTAGHGATLTNLKPDSPSSSLAGFKDRLDMDAITVAGHSYGATGALQALKCAPSADVPFNGGIALDPGKGSGPLNHAIEVPTLVLQSGEWTDKQTQFYDQGWHFAVVRDLVAATRKGWFLTLRGTAHPSVTDAPLIVPWIMRLVTGTTLNAEVALREYIDVSVDFLQVLQRVRNAGPLTRPVSSPEGPLGEVQDRGTVEGSSGGEWEVHVVSEV